MRNLAAATVAVLLVGVGAPGSSASHVESDCRFDAVSQQDVTGNVYEGAAFGYATAVGDTVAVRCVVFVNGAEVTSTPYGPTRPDVAVTAGRVTFTSDAGDVVSICPMVTTTAHGEELRCPQSYPPQLPPEEVYDALDAAFEALGPAWGPVDAQLCPALAAQSPGTPPVAIDPTGDLYVDGVFVWDCPPYGS